MRYTESIIQYFRRDLEWKIGIICKDNLEACSFLKRILTEFEEAQEAEVANGSTNTSASTK